MIAVWWALWIAGFALGLAAEVVAFDDLATPSDDPLYDVLDAFWCAASVGDAVLAAVLVRRITVRLEARAAGLQL